MDRPMTANGQEDVRYRPQTLLMHAPSMPTSWDDVQLQVTIRNNMNSHGQVSRHRHLNTVTAYVRTQPANWR
jgi:hypothetical protein